MKLYAIFPIATLFITSTAASNLFQQLAGNTVDVQAGAKVPGENPFYHCRGTTEDVLDIEKIDLFPNPPVPGQTLKIKAVGTLKDHITEGAKVGLLVKYGYITLIKDTMDLCEHAGEIDQECPVNPGKVVVEKSVEIPKQVPPGKYTVQADAALPGADEIPIVCLTASVVF